MRRHSSSSGRRMISATASRKVPARHSSGFSRPLRPDCRTPSSTSPSCSTAGGARRRIWVPRRPGMPSRQCGAIIGRSTISDCFMPLATGCRAMRTWRHSGFARRLSRFRLQSAGSPPCALMIVQTSFPQRRQSLRVTGWQLDRRRSSLSGQRRLSRSSSTFWLRSVPLMRRVRVRYILNSLMAQLFWRPCGKFLETTLGGYLP